MISRRQTSSGASACTSGQRRRTRRVSGNGCFAPLVTRLAAKHKMMVSQRRIPLSVINIANKADTSKSPEPSLIPEPKMPSPIPASPTIQNVSDEYIREKLPLFKDRYVHLNMISGSHDLIWSLSMLAGLRDVRLANAPQRSGFLPKELQIIASDYLDAIPPTHMLAVYASKSDSGSARTKVTLYPTHEIVLSAHCANLPKLPEPASPTTIPVVPLALPSPQMFPYLQTYLYNKNISALENLLLPPPTQILDTTSLMKRLLAVHGLWGNACALGVIDAPFYAMIERVWAFLHQTLSTAHTLSASSA